MYDASIHFEPKRVVRGGTELCRGEGETSIWMMAEIMPR